MQKLKFMLKNNGNVIYNEKVEYEYLNGCLKFKIQNFFINLKYNKNNFLFIKESDEDIFEIIWEDKKVVSKISTKKPAMMFNMDLDNFNYKFSDKYIFFSYKIKSEEMLEVKVMITF